MELRENELEELKQDIVNREKDLKDLPIEVLATLLHIAIDKIDYLDNIVLPGNDYDQRDAMDLTCDREYILEDLFDEAIENLKYEKN